MATQLIPLGFTFATHVWQALARTSHGKYVFVLYIGIAQHILVSITVLTCNGVSFWPTHDAKPFCQHYISTSNYL